MEVGAFLSYRRKQLGLSLSDVGDVIGYTPQAIYRYEKGNVKVDLSLVDSFCCVLNLSLESFFKMDPESIQPYQGEKFVQDQFCSLLKQELSKDASLGAKAASALSVSPTRIEKWSNGVSLPSVEEFLALARVMGYAPVDLYLGQEKKIVVPLKPRWKIPLVSTLSILAVSACVLTPVLLSRYQQPGNPDTSESMDPTPSIDPIPPVKEKCSVIIQGYDKEDLSPIESIHHQYEVDKGDTLPKPEVKSDYYDYAYSQLDGETFLFESTPIEKDVTIQAFFDKKTFTVTFLGYHNEVLGVSKTRCFSDAVAPSKVEDQGDFRFVKWKEDFTNVKKDLTVHSIFSRFKCSLVLDFDGGEEAGESSAEVSGYSSNLYDSLPSPHKKGHEFIGYYDSKGVRFDEHYSLQSETISLHAVYRPLTYTIQLDGLGQSQEVTYGSEVTSLPDSTENNDIILGWKNGDKPVTLPFVYEDDFDITLTPMLASDYFDFTLQDGSVEIHKIDKWDGAEIDLSSIGDCPITKIDSHALSGLSSLESIVLNQKTVELESSCFENLPSLEKMDFANVDTSSVFHEGIFQNCPNLTYLRSGTPTKNGLSILKLKEYGVTGGEEFTFEFNEATKEYPTSWNEDFGVLGCLKMGEGIQGQPNIQSNGCKILNFVPGNVSYSTITLNLPDLDQEELRFYGTSFVRIEGDAFGKVKRFAMNNGGVQVFNRTKPLEVEEFDMSRGQYVSLRSQTIKADRVLLSDCVGDGYFAPLNEELQVDFYGCSSIPSSLASRAAFTDEGHTRLNFHSEKRYEDDDIIEIPIGIEW